MLIRHQNSFCSNCQAKDRSKNIAAHRQQTAIFLTLYTSPPKRKNWIHSGDLEQRIAEEYTSYFTVSMD